ncbi:hypothetical protein RclHR1_05910002 [Rhizophagus clarus]|uniref:F-box domain-containing protein n=1 Tax=Rhizophagus clarus TaxID=94130 RepID=A0A2Z6SHA4_9GLOM|nr:hypothetical protein RclHR1_05910002 [Rhizophagus clarus]GES79180.1 hypothetical protein GLOIN_2v1774269 [Rhizophagus clarus]
MTCSKVISGDLPELTNEIIRYFQNDFSTLYSCILVNRLWCRLAIPLLWENPFLNTTGNYHFISIYLRNLNENDKTRLNKYGISKDLFPLSTMFNYPSFIKHLNTWNIISSTRKWVAAVRNLSTRKQPINYSVENLSLHPHSEYDIYESLFKIFIENEVNLHTFDVFIFSNNDCDYFNIAFKLILQNRNFLHNIKNLNVTIYPILININIIVPYLKSINSISSLNYNFFCYHNDNNLNDFNRNHLSQIFNSQQKLQKVVFSSSKNSLNYLFTSLKNPNFSNTLKIITFRKINFNNIFNFNEIFEQLNGLESIHIIDCGSLNFFIQQMVNITKPFKLKSLLMKETLQIELLHMLLEKSGNYLENISFGSLIRNESKQQSLELILRYCMKVRFFELLGFDNQNIYLLFNLIENIGQNLNYLSIHYMGESFNTSIETGETSLIVLQNLGQILPFNLEYLDLNLTIKNACDFEFFLKNSQNTFIKRLCIKIKMKESDDILPYIKEYLMKKKRVKYLGVKVKANDLFYLKEEVKEFELYNIKVQNYYLLSSEFVDYLKEIY